MSIESFTEAVGDLKALAIRVYADSESRRRAILALAERFEEEGAEFLGALGRIAIGSKTLAEMSDAELTASIARRALEMTAQLAEEAMGAQVTAANDS